MRYHLSLIEKFMLLLLAKKQRDGKSERGDLKQWETLLSKASFTSKGYYLSERVKVDFIEYLNQHHSYIKDYDKYFLSDTAKEDTARTDKKLLNIIEKFQTHK